MNKTWIGYMLHTEESNGYRAKGQLYVGVISAHSSKNFLIKVPPKKDKGAPSKEVASGK